MNLQKLAYLSIIILTIYYIATDIYQKKQINDIWNWKPSNHKEISKKLKKFDKAQNNYFKEVDKTLNFIQGAEKTINKKIDFSYKDK